MQVVKPFSFTEYDKISDTLMFLNEYYVLRFVVGLKRKNSYNKSNRSFHRETVYIKNGERHYNILLDYKFYFLISNIKEKDDYLMNSVIIRPQDIISLSYLIDNHIMKWYMGDTRIYKMKNERLMISGKYTNAIFPINEGSFLVFSPTVIFTDSNSAKKQYIEGIDITINDNSTIELSLTKFMELAYYLTKTDMVNAAMNLINYIKSPPYGENLFDINTGTTVISTDRRNFFNDT